MSFPILIRSSEQDVNVTTRFLATAAIRLGEVTGSIISFRHLPSVASHNIEDETFVDLVC
jgi:hypothetical protein